MLKNLCDTHTHTIFSRHSYSTIRENVLAARDMGLELLAATDHYSCMLFEGSDSREWQFFYNLSCWPREWEGVKLLHGCEADIVDTNGNLYGYNIKVTNEINGAAFEKPTTLQNRVFKDCDYVIASVHDRSFTRNVSAARNTEMYIKAMQHPKVLELAHMGRSGVDFEFRPVIEEAARLHKLVEINEHSLEYKRETTNNRCREIALLCAELNCPIAVNTDAHICTRIGDFTNALSFLEEIHFPQELIATTDAKTFLAAKALALGEDTQSE